VVRSVVDGVHTDGVDAERLELLNVALATSSVGDWVLSIRCAARLVVDTTDVETLVASEESCQLSAKSLPNAWYVGKTHHFP
jgi:hypothetical protein